MFPGDSPWLYIKDGDPRGYAIFKRHYTFMPYKDNRRKLNRHNLFCGPGEKMVLITKNCDALFVWRKFKSDDGQVGINCAVFRNESKSLSSSLILEAEKLAWQRWPGERLYTYVSAEKTAKRRGKKNKPGHCFLMAGWAECGISKKKGLIILEKFSGTQN